MPVDSINFSDAKSVCAALQKGASLLLKHPSRVGCSIHLPPTGAVWVSGDLHDNPFHFLKIIKCAELTTPSNHVVLQELIHSGVESDKPDLSFRMLVRVALLIEIFPTQVHPILANHELSQATNRRITKGGRELVENFSSGVTYMFGKHAPSVLKAISVFIHAMPLSVRSQGGLMCSHSLPNDEDMPRFDTHILDRPLKKEDTNSMDGSACMMVWGRHHTKEQIETLAKKWNVTLFCLGHAWVPGGIEVAADNVLLLNSDHNNGVVLPIDLEKIEDAEKTAKHALALSSVSLDMSEL